MNINHASCTEGLLSVGNTATADDYGRAWKREQSCRCRLSRQARAAVLLDGRHPSIGILCRTTDRPCKPELAPRSRRLCTKRWIVGEQHLAGQSGRQGVARQDNKAIQAGQMRASPSSNLRRLEPQLRDDGGAATCRPDAALARATAGNAQTDLHASAGDTAPRRRC